MEVDDKVLASVIPSLDQDSKKDNKLQESPESQERKEVSEPEIINPIANREEGLVLKPKINKEEVTKEEEEDNEEISAIFPDPDKRKAIERMRDLYEKSGKVDQAYIPDDVLESQVGAYKPDDHHKFPIDPEWEHVAKLEDFKKKGKDRPRAILFIQAT